ncbi:hypothetical protein AVEN_74064-1 [Araneus ventricosus]|uniref:Uncharacterized protein n=1 Tax=Araneus ventricosus TaxID=182803 RepID=A0A4Y2KQ47_ARAVE|nr:hypothetical protein AVEN_74064-1 [Araneus ventricosus]
MRPKTVWQSKSSVLWKIERNSSWNNMVKEDDEYKITDGEYENDENGETRNRRLSCMGTLHFFSVKAGLISLRIRRPCFRDLDLTNGCSTIPAIGDTLLARTSGSMFHLNWPIGGGSTRTWPLKTEKKH